jgi:four helix bundle protein
MDLQIWHDSVELASDLFAVADRLESKRLYRFAEQLRGAGLSMPTNIAEGSGSDHPREFHQYLNIARRSTFENASLVLVFEKQDLIEADEATRLLQQLDHLCRKTTNFQKTLRS